VEWVPDDAPYVALNAYSKGPNVQIRWLALASNTQLEITQLANRSYDYQEVWEKQDNQDQSLLWEGSYFIQLFFRDIIGWLAANQSSIVSTPSVQGWFPKFPVQNKKTGIFP
jgi:hypothetical protein